MKEIRFYKCKKCKKEVEITLENGSIVLQKTLLEGNKDCEHIVNEL